MLKLGCCFPQA